jgi:N-acetylglucosamine kinase-like BadF-type ATPase
MNYKNQKYVIGVDGGGMKTAAALANLEGKILARVKTGPSNIQKIGLKPVIENISKALNQVSKKYSKDKIVFIYLGLAGGLERDEKKKEEIKKQLLKSSELSWISSKNLLIESDQLIAFRSGTNNKEGVLIIAGAGSIVVGWGSKDKKIIIGGRDYLIGDEGSGFWIGEKVLRMVCCSIDDIAPRTLLQKVVFKKLKIKTESDLLRKIYQSKAVETIASISSIIDKAAEKKDKIARDILFQASQELTIRANSVIQKLNFRNKKFPLVLVGSVFKSKIVLTQIKKRIKKFAPYTDFICPKQEPVIGAIKLAIKQSHA